MYINITEHCEKRLRQLQELVNNEDYDGMNQWAVEHFDDTWLPDDFKQKVIETFITCLEHGISEAAISLGSLYYNGLFIEQDFNKAAHYYEKAAEMGNEMGYCNLAYCYYYGRHCPKDYAQAYKYFSLSVIFFNNAIALYKLGDMYERGYHVQKDPDKAYQLYLRSYQEMSTYDSEYADILLRIARCELRGIGTEITVSQAYNKLCKALPIFYDRHTTDPFVPGIIEECKKLMHECEEYLQQHGGETTEIYHVYID